MLFAIYSQAADRKPTSPLSLLYYLWGKPATSKKTQSSTNPFFVANPPFHFTQITQNIIYLAHQLALSRHYPPDACYMFTLLHLGPSQLTFNSHCPNSPFYYSSTLSSPFTLFVNNDKPLAYRPKLNNKTI